MSDSVAEAQRLFNESMEALNDQRKQIEEDLRFTDPSDPMQWDDDTRRKRESDPGGARPCLVFDQTSQYIQNVSGQVEQRPPSMHAIPATNGDKRVAEKLDGLFRNLEYASRAQQHYARALTSAARVGVGYLTLRPEYTDRALGYQEPRISSEGDPLKVVLDPWSVEIDGSDASYGAILTPYSHREWERKFGKKEKVSFSDAKQGYVRDERESVVAGEVWRVEDRTKNMIVCIDPSTGEQACLSEDDYWENAKRDGLRWPFIRNYSDKQRVVLWSLMSGCDVLSPEVEFPCDFIGIVPVYGYVGWANGRMNYCGIGRRAMASQRSYNYHMSELHAYMAQAPKSPWMVPIEGMADKSVQALWDRANVDTRAWMPYRSVDEQGNSIPAPTRTQVSISLANHIQGAQQAKEDIQASIGMYQANLGAPSNETSGVAIDSRKQQGEASTAVFPAHLAAGISHLGRMAVQMYPRLVDTKRQMRILGIDNTASTVTVDPQQREAVRETEQGLSINPSVGDYDAYCVVGTSFATQRTQAQQAYTEMMRANPSMTPAIAPLWAQTLDVPHADKLAQVLTAMAPPAVQAILNPDASKTPSAGELTAKLGQMQQALQEAIKHAQDAQREADEYRQKYEEAEEDQSIAAYEAETKRMVGLKDAIAPAQIQQLVVQTLETMMRSPDPLQGEPQEMEPGPEAWQAQTMPAEMPEQPPGGEMQEIPQ
jgi:hypothetical protein